MGVRQEVAIVGDFCFQPPTVPTLDCWTISRFFMCSNSVSANSSFSGVNRSALKNIHCPVFVMWYVTLLDAQGNFGRVSLRVGVLIGCPSKLCTD